MHAGGTTATEIDFFLVLTDKLPLFIAVVLLASFVLMAASRSLPDLSTEAADQLAHVPRPTAERCPAALEGPDEIDTPALGSRK